MDDFQQRWRALDGGDQSTVRRASRRGSRVEERLAPDVVAYSRRRLDRWWSELAEIAPAVVVLLLLPLYASRDIGLLTADDAWPARIAGIAVVVVAFVGWRRWRYAVAIRLNDVPGEPVDSR